MHCNIARKFLNTPNLGDLFCCRLTTFNIQAHKMCTNFYTATFALCNGTKYVQLAIYIPSTPSIHSMIVARDWTNAHACMMHLQLHDELKHTNTIHTYSSKQQLRIICQSIDLRSITAQHKCTHDHTYSHPPHGLAACKNTRKRRPECTCTVRCTSRTQEQ
jgi:hypothetical protein